MDLSKDISTLKINKNLTYKLKENNINNIYDLCHYSRLELNQIGIVNQDINNIMIQLQLIGLNLKSNHALKNTLIDK